jgi:hypothetical protein
MESQDKDVTVENEDIRLKESCVSLRIRRFFPDCYSRLCLSCGLR